MPTVGFVFCCVCLFVVFLFVLFFLNINSTYTSYPYSNTNVTNSVMLNVYNLYRYSNSLYIMWILETG